MANNIFSASVTFQTYLVGGGTIFTPKGYFWPSPLTLIKLGSSKSVKYQDLLSFDLTFTRSKRPKLIGIVTGTAPCCRPQYVGNSPPFGWS
jgi:hypothetical protein